MPKVSVIVPCYNHARFLEQRIDSILNQTYQDFELILLDDHSTDDSYSICLSYKDNPHVVHVETNKLCSKIELLNDIITLLHEYIVPTESNIAFYTQLLRGKINLLLRIQNNLEERKVLWDYLEQLKGYYSCSDNTDFYSYYIEPCFECLNKVTLVKNDLNV